MKFLKYTVSGLMLFISFTACKKVIDIDPISNIGVNAFYKNYDEVKIALSGCYNGLHRPLETEFMLTELRSDNAKQGFANSSSPINVEFNDLDLFQPSTSHDKVYQYWLNTYKNIRAINYVLGSLGANYTGGQIVLEEGTAVLTSQQKNQLAGEALFLRAYHYFNLVRLYGGVFLVTEPVDPELSKQTTRSSIQDCYQLITADLNAAKDLMSQAPYSASSSADLGRATSWAAKALLAKVYLTLNQKGNALPLLEDIISNSGHGMVSTYEDVFSINNEMNREIIFAVRYKTGGLGIGSPMANYFAPQGSGNAVINGDGNNYNYPTNEIDSAFVTPAVGSTDMRKEVTMGKYLDRLYVKKFLSQVVVRYDAENDFPVIRYTDVLLMKAEAVGFDGIGGSSVNAINQVRARAGAVEYVMGDFNAAFYLYPTDPVNPNAITNQDEFLDALLKERRLEFAFENQRFFDLVRTGKAIEVMKDHFADEYPSHYANYRPVIELQEILDNVTPERLLLPIPQREIDTNDQIEIQQNPGY